MFCGPWIHHWSRPSFPYSPAPPPWGVKKRDVPGRTPEVVTPRFSQTSGAGRLGAVTYVIPGQTGGWYPRRGTFSEACPLGPLSVAIAVAKPRAAAAGATG